MPRAMYPALIDMETGAGGAKVYGITFPDFPGCVSAGESIVAAIRRGEEALSGHIAAMLADGETLPEPTDLQEYRGQLVKWLNAEGNIEVAHVQLVNVRVPGPPRRINVMLDEDLIEEIDAVANNRSAFLAAAARAELAKR